MIWADTEAGPYISINEFFQIFYMSRYLQNRKFNAIHSPPEDRREQEEG
jgi:hypothetical protein